VITDNAEWLLKRPTPDLYSLRAGPATVTTTAASAAVTETANLDSTELPSAYLDAVSVHHFPSDFVQRITRQTRWI